MVVAVAAGAEGGGHNHPFHVPTSNCAVGVAAGAEGGGHCARYRFALSVMLSPWLRVLKVADTEILREGINR